jgi:hypothetical protein
MWIYTRLILLINIVKTYNFNSCYISAFVMTDTSEISLVHNYHQNGLIYHQSNNIIEVILITW